MLLIEHRGKYGDDDSLQWMFSVFDTPFFVLIALKFL